VRFSVAVDLDSFRDKICEAACREVDMDKTSGLQLMALSRRTIVARSVAAAADLLNPQKIRGRTIALFDAIK
jgi:hypothetical protein